MEQRQERLRHRVHVGQEHAAYRRGQGQPRYQHDDVRDVSHGGGGDARTRQDSRTIRRHDRVRGHRHATGDGDLGWAGREGIDEVLRSGAIARPPMRMRGWWVFVLVCAITAGAPPRGYAQSPPAAGEVTVEELVARALAENPDVRAAQADVDAGQGRLVQAGLRPNPMLELGGQKALSPD